MYSASKIMTNSYKLEKILLLITATWPKKNNRIYSLLSIVFWTVHCVYVFHLWWLMFQSDSLLDLSKILDLTATVSAACLKVASFRLHTKEIKRVEECFSHPLFVSHPQEMNRHLKDILKKTKYIGNFFRALCTVEMISFATYPLIDGSALPIPIPIPYEMKGYKQWLYVLQVFGTICSAWFNSSLDTMTMTWIGIGAAQLKILANKIVLVKNKKREVKEQLQECIQHHLLIIQYVKDVEKIFSFGILCQFMTSIICICNSIFHAILVLKYPGQLIQTGIYSLVVLMEPFMYCWIGGELMHQSIKICDACYFSNWEEYSNGTRKYLFIMMERSRRPIKISAMKFANLTLQIFLEILKWTYTYFALLNSLYQKRT